MAAKLKTPKPKALMANPFEKSEVHILSEELRNPKGGSNGKAKKEKSKKA